MHFAGLAPRVLDVYERGVYRTLRPEAGGIEVRFDTTWDVGGTGVAFCGVVDMLNAGDAIVDFKAVARAHGHDQVRASPQLHLYARHFARRRVAHVQLVKKRSPDVFFVSAEPSVAQLDNSRDWAHRTITSILACRERNDWPVCDPESWACSLRYCDYYNICYRKGD